MAGGGAGRSLCSQEEGRPPAWKRAMKLAMSARSCCISSTAFSITRPAPCRPPSGPPACAPRTLAFRPGPTPHAALSTPLNIAQPTSEVQTAVKQVLESSRGTGRRACCIRCMCTWASK